MNPEPVIVTVIPPATLPLVGDIETISGNVSGSTTTVVVSVFSSPLESVTDNDIRCSPMGSDNVVISPFPITLDPCFQTNETSDSPGP